MEPAERSSAISSTAVGVERDADVRVRKAFLYHLGMHASLQGQRCPWRKSCSRIAGSPRRCTARTMVADPGAFCADAGAKGLTVNGTSMTCKTTAPTHGYAGVLPYAN